MYKRQVNFSGLLKPVSSLAGSAKAMGYSFPSVYFQQISVGTFAKALGFADLAWNYLALAAFFALFLGLSVALLKTQER